MILVINYSQVLANILNVNMNVDIKKKKNPGVRKLSVLINSILRLNSTIAKKEVIGS